MPNVPIWQCNGSPILPLRSNKFQQHFKQNPSNIWMPDLTLYGVRETAPIIKNQDSFIMKSNVPDCDLILYQTEDGLTKVEVRLLDETVWLNQAQMSELFDKDKRTISRHI